MIDKIILPSSGITDFGFFVEKSRIENGFFEHYHDFTEINVIVRGTAIHTINGKPLPIKTGDVFVLNPETSHGFSHADNLILYQVMYNPGLIINNMPILKKMSGYQALFIVEPSMICSDSSFRNFTSLTMKDLETVIITFENMIREFQSKREGFQVLLQADLMSLIIFLSRQYFFTKKGNPDITLRVARTAAYIEKNFLSSLSLKHLSEYSNISVCQLIRDFKKNYGTTPIDYILHLRIEHAILLLKNRALSITDIAYSCCFSDSNYFARIFKQHTGLSPSQYRSKC